jgi:hypothetical protein
MLTVVLLFVSKNVSTAFALHRMIVPVSMVTLWTKHYKTCAILYVPIVPTGIAWSLKDVNVGMVMSSAMMVPLAILPAQRIASTVIVPMGYVLAK